MPHLTRLGGAQIVGGERLKEGRAMIRQARIVGIAIGSLVIAYLAASLVAGVFFGPGTRDSPLVWAVIIVVGGLVFVDIVRRDRPRRRRAA